MDRLQICIPLFPIIMPCFNVFHHEFAPAKHPLATRLKTLLKRLLNLNPAGRTQWLQWQTPLLMTKGTSPKFTWGFLSKNDQTLVGGLEKLWKNWR